MPDPSSFDSALPLLAEHLKVARPSALGDGELTLAWAETSGLSRRKAEDPPNRELIGRAIRAVTGASLRLAHEMRTQMPESEAPTLSGDELIERVKSAASEVAKSVAVVGDEVAVTLGKRSNELVGMFEKRALEVAGAISDTGAEIAAAMDQGAKHAGS